MSDKPVPAVNMQAIADALHEVTGKHMIEMVALGDRVLLRDLTTNMPLQSFRSSQEVHSWLAEIGSEPVTSGK